METIIYNQKGEKSGKMELPASVFGTKWNPDLVHQVVFSMLSNKRTPVAHTKGRGEVSGGGKKPWKQKGTGRARHGSSRSPIWVGGGVTHGPINEKNYTKKINRKMKAKALYTVLSQKLKDNEIIFVDQFSFTAPKTKDARQVLLSLSKISGFEGLAKKKNNAALISIGEKSQVVEKSFSNFNNLKVDESRNLNPVDLLNYKYLVITHPKESIDFLSGKMN
ncbi:MAG: 50S ribosomal protein L4 [Candidatus Paceibacterota bacterium]